MGLQLLHASRSPKEQVVATVSELNSKVLHTLHKYKQL